MGLKVDKRYVRVCAYTFVTACAVILFWQSVSHFDTVRKTLAAVGKIMSPFAYGFGLAFILSPVLRWVEQKLLYSKRIPPKAKRNIGIFITYILALAAITVLLWIVLPEVTKSLTSLVNKVMLVAYTYESWLPKLAQYLPVVDYEAEILSFLEEYATSIAKQTYTILTTQVIPRLSNLTVNIASGALKIVVGLIISIYILADKERFQAGIKRLVYGFLRCEDADWMLELTHDCGRIFGGFIVGKIIDSAIIGVLCFVGVSLLGMPNAMLVSMIVGVTNVIPYFGPFIGAIPSFFIILIDNPMKSLIFLVFVFALQQFDGNILGPKILGDSTGLNAFWVIFAITLFGGLFGFMGMFLGVPVFSVLMVLYKQFLKHMLRRKRMPLGLRAYAPAGSPYFTEADELLYPGSSRRRAEIHYVDPLENEKDVHPHEVDAATHQKSHGELD